MALSWLLEISVLEYAVSRRYKEVYELEKVADCVRLSRWSSCRSSDARRFRHIAFSLDASKLRAFMVGARLLITSVPLACLSQDAGRLCQ
jgi:hypothetical protein